MTSLAILLAQLGTPAAPSPRAVRKYLRAFLSDRRVIEIPRFFWLPLLYAVILPLRGRSSARLYQKIWQPEGSPLKIIFEKQIKKLQIFFKHYATEQKKKIEIFGAMRYGMPSFESVLADIKKKRFDQLLFFPLFPQYAAPTTASCFDTLSTCLKTFRYQPALRMINSYYNHPVYITALCKHIQTFWEKQEKASFLLFSFHGLPQRFIEQGDPYYNQCLETARLVAHQLKLQKDKDYTVGFQSRFGLAPWLEPYTDKLLKNLPDKKGIKNIHIICPGFSADCLETLEEINHQMRIIFLKAGGENFAYIPALNDTDDHIHCLAQLILSHIQSWD